MAGIEVRVDTSWVLIAVLITYSLTQRFGFAFPEVAGGGAVALGVGFALLFFASILFHEMAHAVVARGRGIEVRGITLFMFGGATHARVESKGPTDELIVSIVGPLSSLLLAGGLFAAHLPLRDVAPPLAGGLRYVAGINVALAIFNMVPGFPLDGGRVLRSIVWRVTGNRSTATRVASVSGQIVGYGLIALGALALVRNRIGSAIWLLMIGWFLAQAARASRAELRVRSVLEGAAASDVMSPLLEPVEPFGDHHRVAPETPMTDVLGMLEDEEDRRRVLVLREGLVVGVITHADLARWLEARQLRTA